MISIFSSQDVSHTLKRANRLIAFTRNSIFMYFKFIRFAVAAIPKYLKADLRPEKFDPKSLILTSSHTFRTN